MSRNKRSSPLHLWQIALGLTLLLGIGLGIRWGIRPRFLQDLPSIFNELFTLIEFGTLGVVAVLWLLVVWKPTVRKKDGKREDEGAFSAEEMHQLTPEAFEEYVAVLFRQQGYAVTRRGGAGDLGVDLELTKWTGERAIVQCKRYKKNVGPVVVRELYGTLRHEFAVHAFLVTTASISKSARDWADNKPMTLIDGTQLSAIAEALDIPPYTP